MKGDYITVARGGRRALVLSASTGETLHYLENPYGDGYYIKSQNIAMDGDLILYSMWESNSLEIKVLLFNKVTGKFITHFEAPAENTNRNFGNVVAMDGDYIAVSSNEPGGGDTSKVYVFSISARKLVRTFRPPFVYDMYKFGASIAIDGNSILIGDDRVNEQAGAVYHFDISTGELIEAFIFPLPPNYDELYPQRYSYSRAYIEMGGLRTIAIDGNSALIGVPKEVFIDTGEVGEAYLFSLGSGGTDGGTDSGTESGIGGGTEAGKSYQIQSPSGFVLTVLGNVGYDSADVQGGFNQGIDGQKWTITEEGILKNGLGDFALDMVPIGDDTKQSVQIKALDPNSSTQKWEFTADGQLKNKSNGFVAVLTEYKSYPGFYFVDAFAPSAVPLLRPFCITCEDTWQFNEI